MKKYVSLLRVFGISEKGITIYLTLLRSGLMSRTDISNATGLHRVDLYRHIPLLVDMGLVLVVVRGKRDFFIAASPEILRDKFEQIQEDTHLKINQMIDMFDQHDREKPVIIYHDKNTGVTEAFRDIMNTQKKGDTLYRISSEIDVAKVNQYMPENYRKIRSEKNIQMYLIMPEGPASQKKSRLDREMVVIPTKMGFFKENVSMSIYNNKISYMDYSTGSAIIIEHEQIASFQKQIFQLLFKSLRHI